MISRSPCLPRKYTTESGRRASWNKKREDSEISECGSDDEGNDVEMDNTGSEYSHEDMLRNITHMINFANTKDDRYLKFLLPMQSMTEDTIMRRKMVKNKEHLICLSVELLLLCHNKTIFFIKVFILILYNLLQK